MFKKILCAVDGSDHSLKAANLASQMAQLGDAQLTFLTVTKELKMTDELKRYMEIEHLAGEPQYVLDDYTEKVIQEAKEAARAAGLSNVKAEAKTGQPARVIVSMADRGGYDVIVLGSRGHGDLEGLLLGSVSHKVANLAKCTVITVK
ncbi:MAG: universal stress protein [Rhodospirillales bacterium]|nr:universal stress protein [Rhodospirillales bacterium]